MVMVCASLIFPLLIVFSVQSGGLLTFRPRVLSVTAAGGFPDYSFGQQPGTWVFRMFSLGSRLVIEGCWGGLGLCA